jgi:glutamate 5-kinase
VKIVAKVGTSSITAADGTIDEAAIAKFCAEVAGLRGAGHSVVAAPFAGPATSSPCKRSPPSGRAA